MEHKENYRVKTFIKKTPIHTVYDNPLNLKKKKKRKKKRTIIGCLHVIFFFLIKYERTYTYTWPMEAKI